MSSANQWQVSVYIRFVSEPSMTVRIMNDAPMGSSCRSVEVFGVSSLRKQNTSKVLPVSNCFSKLGTVSLIMMNINDKRLNLRFDGILS